MAQGPLDVLWAKTSKTGDWHLLRSHLTDATLAAAWLWDDWLGPLARAQVRGSVAGGDDGARALFLLLAGLHDLGKASPAFQIQVPSRAETVRAAGLPIPAALPDRLQAPHSTVSGCATLGHLESLGWSRQAASTLGCLLAAHHGRFPSFGWTNAANEAPYLHGTGAWVVARAEVLRNVSRLSGADVRLEEWEHLDLSQPQQLALTGLVILADWVASSEQCFPLAGQVESNRYEDVSRQRADALDKVLGWGRPWLPKLPSDPAVLFSERFAFEPRPVQRVVAEVAAGAEGPGLLLVEAPMGEGKTEAAFAAAEIVGGRLGASGLFIGLPTQATTGAMWRRVTDWLPGGAGVALAHGKAGLDPLYEQLLSAPTRVPTGVEVDAERSDSELTASEWFTGRKKRLLAPVVVGTVDQILFAALRARHVALRFAGLLGKVIVIDEVHAYDAFMSVFLERALRWLGALGAPVVLLSATLPPEARRRLVAAYLGSRPSSAQLADLDVLPYPAVIHVAAGGQEPVVHDVAGPTRRTVVQVSQLDEPNDDPDGPLVPLLVDRLAHGGCALVVRNTVRRAQQTYRCLVETFPRAEVTLTHARFTVADRLSRDEDLLTCFGRDPGSRPYRHVVVATQVVEQSLDVDFDLLVTDLAPMDLLLQRMGRMHRHERSRPDPVSRPEVVVAGQRHRDAAPPELPFGSRAVYGEWLLWRSAAVLHGVEQVVIPEDIPPLVTAVYGGEPLGPAEWAPALADARRQFDEQIRVRRDNAGAFALPAPRRGRDLTGLDSATAGEVDEEDAEAQGYVRDGRPTIEVALLVESAEGGALLLDGTPVPLDGVPDTNTTRAILRQLIRLPDQVTSYAAELPVPSGWTGAPWLGRQRGLCLDPAGAGTAEGMLGDRWIRYDAELGLTVTR